MPEPLEQALVLEQIRMFVKHMNYGRVTIEECPGEIKLHVTVSREMQE